MKRILAAPLTLSPRATATNTSRCRREYLIYRNLRRRISNHPVLPKTSWLLNVHEKRGQREQSQPRTGAFGPPLERLAIQLQDHQESDLTLSKWAFRDDRARGREPTALARVQRGERQLRRAPRVLQHQNRRRCAHLASPARRPRRCGVREHQTNRHLDRRQRPPWPTALSAGERYWPRSLHEHHS